MTGSDLPIWLAAAPARDWLAPEPARAPIGFHRGLPGYRPTPLTQAPRLAAELGVGQVFVKDESARLGLPAFKILGAAWAIERALAAAGSANHSPSPRPDGPRPDGPRPDGPRPDGPGPDGPGPDGPGPDGQAPTALVAATDGNHGRAVARVAGQRGLAARIFIPAAVHPSAAAAVAAEGATVVRVDGSYDDAVARAAEDARGTGALLIQDLSWPGYEEIPAWIVEGYQTMFAELDEQLPAPADLLVVPVGVGSLAQAAIGYYRSPDNGDRPALLSAEPDRAACGLHSLRAGRMLTIPTSATIMAGLNCGTLSAAAWPYLRSGLDAAAAVTDEQAATAASDLAACSVPAGPCGAATLAAARIALTGEGSADRRVRLGISAASTIVLICTEGSAANPVSHTPPD